MQNNNTPPFPPQRAAVNPQRTAPGPQATPRPAVNPSQPTLPAMPQADPILSPQKEFERFTATLRAKVKELQDQTFTKKEAWFIFNDVLLRFVARCNDEKLREEAFKIVKYLAENVPAAEDLKDTELDRPFAEEMRLDEILDLTKSGNTISPEEIAK